MHKTPLRSLCWLLILVSNFAWSQQNPSPAGAGIPHGELNLTLSGSEVPRDPFAYAEKKGTANAQTYQACRNKSLQYAPATGNGAADFRCRLVAFEVCMYNEGKIQSQSQGSATQCQVIRGLAGPAACQKPCAEAAATKKGGTQTVTFRANQWPGLTEFAASCWAGKTKGLGGAELGRDSCAVSDALECLINASSDPKVNERIAQERRKVCQTLADDKSPVSCVSCVAGRPRIDYNTKRAELTTVDPQALRDAIGQTGDTAAQKRQQDQWIETTNKNQCNPLLQSQGLCTMP